MSLMMRMASAMEDAWNPMLRMPRKSCSAVTGPLSVSKSSSSTGCASGGISWDSWSTASLAADGGAPRPSIGARGMCRLMRRRKPRCFHARAVIFVRSLSPPKKNKNGPVR